MQKKNFQALFLATLLFSGKAFCPKSDSERTSSTYAEVSLRGLDESLATSRDLSSSRSLDELKRDFGPGPGFALSQAAKKEAATVKIQRFWREKRLFDQFHQIERFNVDFFLNDLNSFFNEARNESFYNYNSEYYQKKAVLFNQSNISNKLIFQFYDLFKEDPKFFENIKSVIETIYKYFNYSGKTTLAFNWVLLSILDSIKNRKYLDYHQNYEIKFVNNYGQLSFQALRKEKASTANYQQPEISLDSILTFLVNSISAHTFEMLMGNISSFLFQDFGLFDQTPRRSSSSSSRSSSSSLLITPPLSDPLSSSFVDLNLPQPEANLFLTVKGALEAALGDPEFKNNGYLNSLEKNNPLTGKDVDQGQFAQGLLLFALQKGSFDDSHIENIRVVLKTKPLLKQEVSALRSFLITKNRQDLVDKFSKIFELASEPRSESDPSDPLVASTPRSELRRRSSFSSSGSSMAITGRIQAYGEPTKAYQTPAQAYKQLELLTPPPIRKSRRDERKRPSSSRPSTPREAYPIQMQTKGEMDDHLKS